jgi:PGF-pre-PGF domain-containing protein
MNVRLQIFIAIIVCGLLAGNAVAATITFDKSLDVPDRTFTWQNKTYYITNIGNYKLNDNINFGITSGTDTMLVVLYDSDQNSVKSETKFNTGGQTSVSFPAGTVSVPGIYGIVVSSKPDAIIIGANPLIISEYDMTVTPNVTNAKQGDTLKVIVHVSKNGAPVSVAPNNVEVKFGQGSTYFPDNAIVTATATGTYEANIQIPSTAYGSHKLYAAITTGKEIYGYPELMGAAGYSGTIELPTPSSTSTPSSPGGASGGGSAPSGEEFKNIELKETYENYISKDSPSSYAFRLANNPVSEVSITSNINAGDVAVKIEVLRGSSSQVNSPASGNVYKNINIMVGKSGFAVPKNIKEGIIKFRVENSWITSNNLASSDVNMERWDGSKWAQIYTSETNSDATYTYYEAKTDSFSSFAITALKEVVAPTATPEIVVTETVTPIETTPAAPPTEKEAPGFEAAVTVLTVTLLAGSLIRGRKRR